MSIEMDMATAHRLAPKRPADGHKGTFGHLFVIAGSRGFTGAAKLVGLAAARSGVGLVTVGVPRPLGDVAGAGLIEVMTFMLPATESESVARAALEPALDFAADKDAVALGPGLSRHSDTEAFALEMVRRCPAPMLVDADGLNALSAQPEVLRDAAGARVLTPHPGEMARLTGLKAAEIQKDREGVARDFASRHHCTVVLKGHHTVIASAAGGEVYVNPTGNSGMATGGTGDVLTGIIGGLMAQGLAGFEAALLGVYLHGLAGDFAASARTGRALIASDVIEAMPDAWRAIEQGAHP